MAELSLADLFQARFVRGGRDLRTGLDCQGLFLEVMRRYGHRVDETAIAEYATATVAAGIAHAAASGRWQPLAEPEAGCAVVMALDPDHPGVAQHLGVCIGRNRFIQILEGHGVIVRELTDRFFAGKIRGYYRWIG